MRGTIEYSVTVEEEINAPWVGDFIQRTTYSKTAFPSWNIITMGIEYTCVSQRGIGNTMIRNVNIISPIRGLGTKLSYLNILGP